MHRTYMQRVRTAQLIREALVGLTAVISAVSIGATLALIL